MFICSEGDGADSRLNGKESKVYEFRIILRKMVFRGYKVQTQKKMQGPLLGKSRYFDQ